MLRSARLLLLALVAPGCMVAVTPGPVSPPPPPPAIVQIVSGTYGGNCGQPRGNVTPHLAQTCNGQPACAYRVDYQVIGDPAVGCGKDYVAEWSCTGSPQVYRASAPPEAGYGAVVQIGCGMQAAPPPPVTYAPPPPQRLGPIVVRSGSYGPNCGAAHGNVTAHLAEACNGRWQCPYRVDYRVIGDPAVGCGKTYVAEWTCGEHPFLHRLVAPPEAGYGAVLDLRCP
jgi:hypothetical protein